MVEVPQGPVWRFERNVPQWEVWAHPVPGSQYVLGLDPMSGEDDENKAWHAIEVIDHLTREQVAEYRSREDPDLLAIQAYLAALRWNRAWIAVEITGGFGLSIVRKLWKDYRYPMVYTRKALDSRREKMEDRLGWDTKPGSKSLLEDGAKEMLRKGQTGIHSRLLARELTTYTRDRRGRTGPERGKHSDLLMAWMIAQAVAQEKPRRPAKRVPGTSFTRPLTYAQTGY